MSQSLEIIKRALNTGNMLANFTHEDLSDLITFTTPRDVPMFKMLARGTASQFLHEWRERSLTNTIGQVYDGETGLPTGGTNTGTPRNNKVAQFGRVATATEFIQAMNTVGKASQGLDAYALDLQEQMQTVMRDIEHQIWNGDITQTAPQQMDGIIKLSASFQTVQNNATPAALVQLKLDELIAKIYEAGGDPDVIACLPTVAQRIATFNADKIRYVEGGGAGGVNEGTFTYLSPFGYQLKVVPVRADFMPTGSVYVLSTKHIKLCSMGDGPEIKLKDLPIVNDDVARTLVKAYLTLEVKALAQHGKLSNVASALS